MTFEPLPFNVPALPQHQCAAMVRDPVEHRCEEERFYDEKRDTVRRFCERHAIEYDAELREWIASIPPPKVIDFQQQKAMRELIDSLEERLWPKET